MILSDEERKIVLQAMSLVHCTTDSERDLMHRLSTGNDTVERKKAATLRQRNFHAWLHTIYGSKSGDHKHEYYDFCQKNSF